MSDGLNPYRRTAPPPARQPLGGNGGATGLAEVLERVLDRGLVIAGDVQINLLDIELLTLKVRLLLASADTAEQLGIDWWRSDPFLSADAAKREREQDDEAAALRARVAELESVVAALTDGEPREEAADRDR